MAISTIGGTGSDNWELISSVTPTAASAAVNFTGLSPYKKIIVKVDGVELNISGTISVRLNNDSSTYAYFMGRAVSAGNEFYYDKAAFLASQSTATGAFYGYLSLSSCDNAGAKILEAGGFATGGTLGATQGVYWGTAIVTQVNVITTTTFKALGTVALYGVK